MIPHQEIFIPAMVIKFRQPVYKIRHPVFQTGLDSDLARTEILPCDFARNNRRMPSDHLNGKPRRGQVIRRL
jgi:hypothetical protein